MYTHRSIFLVIGDSIAFILGFIGFIGLAFPRGQFLDQAFAHAPSFLFLILIWIGVFYVFNFYDIPKAKPNVVFLRNFGIASIIMLGIGFAFFYLNPITAIAPKSNLLLFLSLSLIIILGIRRLFYQFTKKSIHTHCVIIGNESSADLVNLFHTHPELGFACIGTYPDIASYQNSNPSAALVIIDTRNGNRSSEIIPLLGTASEVIDIAEAYERIFYKIPVDLITPEWIIHSIKKQSTALYELISRILGIVVAVIIIIITLPVTIITALLIKLTDRGPIFYHQTRTGLHGKPFKLYKFRSMIVNSEKDGAVWAGVYDHRITRIGSIIRKLHIDEIPQMWNIIRGDIGLVGPRAERPEFVTELEQQIPYYIMRHTVRPGFTGWAQIKFRYARSIADSQEKFEYDLYYIKNRNIFMDIGIIIKTAQIIFTHD
jgi:exopolysaccharide biosynthesis polyprenyl glycosylphosphotransferase